LCRKDLGGRSNKNDRKKDNPSRCICVGDTHPRQVRGSLAVTDPSRNSSKTETRRGQKKNDSSKEMNQPATREGIATREKDETATNRFGGGEDCLPTEKKKKKSKKEPWLGGERGGVL